VPRYAVFLRGINVGRAKQVAMADVRATLEGLGHTDVTTVLRSGNAVFTAPRRAPAALEQEIERALDTELGLQSTCLVRTAAELQAVVDADPFGETAANGSRYLALFLSAQPSAALLREHDPCALAPDEIRLGDRVLYQWCPSGFMDAPALGPFVEKHLGVRTTGRNWNTVTKLVALVDA
jgi:uncharacterized protein (DUF1697 family)